MNHPYKEYESFKLWEVMNKALNELNENYDIEITTREEYVIGYLYKNLENQGLNFKKIRLNLLYLDFSVSNLAYDTNGNILTMNQNRLKLNASSPVDQLTYSFQSNSNKLLQVTNSANDNTSKLGDFKYDASTKTSTDYLYDVNGNMKRAQQRLGLDGKLRTHKVKFTIDDQSVNVTGPRTVKAGKTGTRGGGTEFSTQQTTRIKIREVSKLKNTGL